MATYAGRYDEPLLKYAGGRLVPATAATVTVYEEDGTTVATLYTDRTKAVTADNPVSPDGFGNLQFFAEPGYYVLSVVENATVQDTHPITVPFDPEEAADGGVTSVNGETGAVTLTAGDISDLTEAIQDAVGAMATDSATVNFTYDDGAGTLTAVVQGLTTSDVSGLSEAIDDRVSALLVAGSNVTLTYDDVAGTLTIAASGGGGGGATNLAWNAATSTVTSDTGTDATLTAVDGTNPGLMTVAQKSKLDGIESNATADQTAAEILTAIKTVDGSGSGLDADTVDGVEAAALAPLASPTFTGTPAAPTATAGTNTTQVATTAFVTTAIANGTSGLVAATDYEDADVLAKVKNVDGAGSGLDADLLDGLHATAFADADGEYAVNTVAASGAAETLTLAPAHRVTMDQNCTFTFPTPTAGHTFLLWLSGAFTPTFPASVDWDTATPPTYASPSLYGFTTMDGGTTWIGSLVASAAA